MKYILSLIVAIASSGLLQAQTGGTIVPDTLTLSRNNDEGMILGIKGGKDTVTKKQGKSIYIGSGGIHYEDGPKDTVEHTFSVQFGMLDLGVNSLIDNTDYNAATNPGLNSFLQVNDQYRNKDLFSLRQSKSINVNVYPVMVKANLYRSPRQKIILATGLGLQLYNFRFTKPVSYRSEPTPHVAMDTMSFSKNKLAFNYLMVPLMLTSKTRLSAGSASTKTDDKGVSTVTHSKGLWLTYGVGVSGGYLLSSWTKQKNDEIGKQKNHDPFNFNKTNFCVNGEIGLDGYFRLFASYQLTALHENYLDQHPFSVGVRFLGL
jgi:hypothetical protein